MLYIKVKYNNNKKLKRLLSQKTMITLHLLISKRTCFKTYMVW